MKEAVRTNQPLFFIECTTLSVYGSPEKLLARRSAKKFDASSRTLFFIDLKLAFFTFATIIFCKLNIYSALEKSFRDSQD